MRDELFLRYLGKVTGRHAVPRPDRSQPEWQAADEATLRRHQAAWDRAREWARENERMRAERLAEVDAREAARERARREAAEAQLIAELRRRYFAADPAATEADFQRDLPELRRQHRIAAALREPDRPATRPSWYDL